MSYPLITSCYYTFLDRTWKNTVKSFRNQCEKLELPHAVQRVYKKDIPKEIMDMEVRGNRGESCRYNKVIPWAINWLMDEYQQDILYCHADTKFLGVPPESAFTHSVMINHGMGRNKWRLLASPVYVAHNPYGQEFLKKWQEACLRFKKGFEHYALVNEFQKEDPEIAATFNIQMSSRRTEDNPYMTF